MRNAELIKSTVHSKTGAYGVFAQFPKNFPLSEASPAPEFACSRSPANASLLSDTNPES
jgi:hypothetical protein